ncbi:MAG: type II toxin-antitoxin system VapC family toxin [Hyphomonadaceae bacterium]|nr:type II toxin-antitoxin system VapC family toxin [Hyphomonadaceae bacterium]
MKLLLDTHAYIWWTSDLKRLSAKARKAIGARASHVHVSAISAYEMAFKHRSGDLPRVGPLLMRLDEDLAERGFTQLPVTLEHGRRAGELADEHGDPFDRLLAAQAIVERMAIVTNDEKLAALGATCLW